jgi:hypothetical protein
VIRIKNFYSRFLLKLSLAGVAVERVPATGWRNQFAAGAPVEVQRRLSWRTVSPIWQSLWFITFNYFVLI